MASTSSSFSRALDDSAMLDPTAARSEVECDFFFLFLMQGQATSRRETHSHLLATVIALELEGSPWSVRVVAHGDENQLDAVKRSIRMLFTSNRQDTEGKECLRDQIYQTTRRRHVSPPSTQMSSPPVSRQSSSSIGVLYVHLQVVDSLSLIPYATCPPKLRCPSSTQQRG